MTDKEMTFAQDGLTVTAQRVSMGWVVRWVGASDARNPTEFLSPIVARMISEMKGSSVTIDFTGLTYMNSSTVSPIIGMLKSLNANKSQADVEAVSQEPQGNVVRVPARSPFLLQMLIALGETPRAFASCCLVSSPAS